MSMISFLFLATMLALVGVVVWMLVRGGTRRRQLRGFDVGPPRPPEN